MRPILLDIVTNVITPFTLFRTYPQITSPPFAKGEKGIYSGNTGDSPKIPLFQRETVQTKIING